MSDIDKEADAILAFMSQGHHSAEAIRAFLVDTLNALTSQAYREGLEAKNHGNHR